MPENRKKKYAATAKGHLVYQLKCDRIHYIHMPAFQFLQHSTQLHFLDRSNQRRKIYHFPTQNLLRVYLFPLYSSVASLNHPSAPQIVPYSFHYAENISSTQKVGMPMQFLLITEKAIRAPALSCQIQHNFCPSSYSA